jgi:ASC-1-like (ASCH) protein
MFEAIRDGRKTIETRAGSVAYQKIQEGDTLVLLWCGERIEKVVKKREHFDSVQSVFESPDFADILLGVTTLGEAEKIYYSFPGYKERIAKHGILAFYFL